MRSLPVKFTKRADKHVDREAEWWETNRLAAPNMLAEALERVLDLISTFPHAGETAVNVRLRGIRRVYLQQTGHHIYYRVVGDPPKMIQVVAFWHSSRKTGPRV